MPVSIDRYRFLEVMDYEYHEPVPTGKVSLTIEITEKPVEEPAKAEPYTVVYENERSRVYTTVTGYFGEYATKEEAVKELKKADRRMKAAAAGEPQAVEPEPVLGGRFCGYATLDDMLKVMQADTEPCLIDHDKARAEFLATVSKMETIEKAVEEPALFPSR